MFNLKPSCCRARLLSHSRVHIKWQLTSITDSLNQVLRILFCSLNIYSSFLFSSPDQVPKPRINFKNPLFLSIVQVGSAHWSSNQVSNDLCVCPRHLSPSSVPTFPLSSFVSLVMTGGRQQGQGGGCGAYCWSGEMVKYALVSNKIIVPAAKFGH